MTGIHRPAPSGRRGGDHDAGPDAAPENPAVAEDRALLVRLRGGEDAAFGELFSRHCDAVRRLALGLVNDRAEAEDLTAEAFFRVLQAIRRGSGPVDNVRGYLLIVARRVAWEWNSRRRDVPVSDEELTYRADAHEDDPGQATERHLISRAFTSLPERWRSVLWKVEVEGERPAVVAVNFGLSPNATAALARRARQGLRAAYLQAHLTVDRGSTGCRSVLEKLGAYTAGTIRGTERRKVRAHLTTCAACTSMHAELRDVCSGLRAHAAFLAVPVAVLAGGLSAAGGSATTTVAVAAKAGAGFGAVKSALVTVKAQVVLAATSAAAVGVFGLVAAPWGAPDRSVAQDDLDGRQNEQVVTGTPDPTGSGSAPALVVPEKALTGKLSARPRETAGARKQSVRPPATAGATSSSVRQTEDAGARVDAAEAYDENQPVVFQQSSYDRQWVIFDGYQVVSETTEVTKVNAADQTTVATKTTTYTQYPSAKQSATESEPVGSVQPTPTSQTPH